MQQFSPSLIPRRIARLLFIQVKRVVLFVLLYVPPHGFSLLDQSGRHLLVHVGEKQFGVGFQPFLGALEGLHDRLAGLFAPASLVVLAPPAAGRHVMPEPGDGMVLLVPVVDLVHRAVGRAVVTGAVVANPAGFIQSVPLIELSFLKSECLCECFTF